MFTSGRFGARNQGDISQLGIRFQHLLIENNFMFKRNFVTLSLNEYYNKYLKSLIEDLISPLNHDCLLQTKLVEFNAILVQKMH